MDGAGTVSQISDLEIAVLQASADFARPRGFQLIYRGNPDGSSAVEIIDRPGTLVSQCVGAVRISEGKVSPRETDYSSVPGVPQEYNPTPDFVNHLAEHVPGLVYLTIKE